MKKESYDKIKSIIDNQMSLEVIDQDVDISLKNLFLENNEPKIDELLYNYFDWRKNSEGKC